MYLSQKPIQNGMEIQSTCKTGDPQLGWNNSRLRRFDKFWNSCLNKISCDKENKTNFLIKSESLRKSLRRTFQNCTKPEQQVWHWRRFLWNSDPEAPHKLALQPELLPRQPFAYRSTRLGIGGKGERRSGKPVPLLVPTGSYRRRQLTARALEDHPWHGE